MPVYEYNCPKCGVIEVNQRIIEAPLSNCPRCKRKVHKLISQTSFQLKGSGWYATDYSRGNGKGNGKAKKDAETSAGEPPASAGASKTEKTETKPKETTPSSSTSK